MMIEIEKLKVREHKAYFDGLLTCVCARGMLQVSIRFLVGVKFEEKDAAVETE